MKDWKANSKSVFSTMAASSHSSKERAEHDFYATDPKAVNLLLQVWQGSNKIWECAAGTGHMSNALRNSEQVTGEPLFDEVIATDLVVRDNLLDNSIFELDFLSKLDYDNNLEMDIVTNPPYKYAEEFIRQALHVIADGYYVCMFLPIRYLEGKARKKLFAEYPPYKVVILSERLECAKNGNFTGMSSAQGYAWFIWQVGTKSKTIIEWV